MLKIVAGAHRAHPLMQVADHGLLAGTELRPMASASSSVALQCRATARRCGIEVTGESRGLDGGSKGGGGRCEVQALGLGVGSDLHGVEELVLLSCRDSHAVANLSFLVLSPLDTNLVLAADVLMD